MAFPNHFLVSFYTSLLHFVRGDVFISFALVAIRVFACTCVTLDTLSIRLVCGHIFTRPSWEWHALLQLTLWWLFSCCNSCLVVCPSRGWCIPPIVLPCVEHDDSTVLGVARTSTTHLLVVVLSSQFTSGTLLVPGVVRTLIAFPCVECDDRPSWEWRALLRFTSSGRSLYILLSVCWARCPTVLGVALTSTTHFWWSFCLSLTFRVSGTRID